MSSVGRRRSGPGSGEQCPSVLKQQQWVEARVLRGPVALLLISITATPLVYLGVLDQVRLLSECLTAHFASERFLPCVCPQVNFDIGLVEETSIADGTPVDGLLLA